MRGITCYRICAVFISTSGLLMSSAGWAQQDVAATDAVASELVGAEADRDEAADRSIVQSQGTMERSGFVPVSPVFQLSTGADETEVSLGLSTEIGQTESRPVAAGDRRTSATTRFSIQGFAPVDDDGEDVFVNLASPLGGARLKIGFTHYTSTYTITPESVAEARRVLNLSMSNCVQRTVDAWRLGRSEPERALAAQYLEAYQTGMGRARPARAESVLVGVNRAHDDEGEERFADLPDELKQRCLVGAAETSVSDNEDLIRTFGDDAAVDSVTRAITANALTYFYGLEATISQEEFSFLDRDAFELSDDNRVGYQVTVFGGMIGGSGNWSLRGGVSHAQSYSAADEVELCQPVGTAGQLQCLAGPDGPPSRNRSTVVSVEGRQLVRLGSSLIPNLGIAPEFAYDVDSDEFTIDVPIYLAANADGELTGGVRFGYSSEDDDVAFGIFVGVPFTVFR